LEQLLTTKLFIPPTRPELVSRPRLIARLNEGLHRKLTLISAPAGYGKTTLLSEWIPKSPRYVTWLSLDDVDNDPTRFWTYIIASLQGLRPDLGNEALALLQSPQPPKITSILTTLINEIATFPDSFAIVLDDYHVIDTKSVDKALTFLLKNLPPQMHLIITSREDPNLPLALLRARGQLTELRITDLRFTPSEAAEFLNQVMDLNLSAEDITALETRTEGWIAGLQLAAISMQGHQDAANFIKSFTGSHHFVMDYLVEEVLGQQPERVQTFLLRTSILDRLCGPLCDTLTDQEDGQATLEYLQQANLFIVPLDNVRRWYRYHHLFADLLRKRLHQKKPAGVAELNRRASIWYEENGLEIEAFQHAAAANDIERAVRLIEGKGMPLQFRGAMAPVMNWLASLPTTELDARPSLWVTYASALTMLGQPTSRVEEILQAAEAALDAATLESAEQDERTRDLIGQIASIRAMLAIPQNQVETIVTQSRRALEYLRPDNLPVRTTATWTLGYAHQLQGDRAAAIRDYTEAISISQASGNAMITIAATTCLGQVQEAENQLYMAAESFRRVLQLAGDPSLPAACEAHLGLARISYQWNNLDAAQQHGQQSLHLALQMENVNTPAAGWAMLGRLKFAQGDAAGATVLLSKGEQFLRQHHSAHRMSEVTAAQVLSLLNQGDLKEAADLAEKHGLPISQARVHLARGDPPSALVILEPLRQEAEAKGWQDKRLAVMVLQAVAHQAHGEKEQAVQVLGEALALAEPGGFIRIFVDEGPPMLLLLQETAKHGTASNYVRQLLKAFGETEVKTPVAQHLIEPLTERELEVLRLLATYLKGPEIARELMVSLNTMRTHTKNIYNKLGVNNRQAAVRRAKELDLL
jgi:LuxR family maltose regulon positive regulatory protein